MPLCPKCPEGYEQLIPRVIKSVLIFLPIWVVVNAVFGYNSFLGPGVFEGKELIYWQNLILKSSLILMLLLFIVMLLLDKKKIALMLIIFLAIPLAGYGCFFTVKHYYSSFTPEKWQNHRESRHLMVNDMLQKNKLYGKNPAEIEALLGPAEPGPYEIGNREYMNRSYYLVHDTSWLFLTRKQFLIIYYDSGYVKDFELAVYEVKK